MHNLIIINETYFKLISKMSIFENWEQSWNFRIHVSLLCFVIGSRLTSKEARRFLTTFWLVDFKVQLELWLVSLDPHIKHFLKTFPFTFYNYFCQIQVIAVLLCHKIDFVDKIMKHWCWKKNSFLHNKGSLGAKWKQASWDHGHIQLWALFKVSD